jgi:hypothetical protein
MSKRLLVNRARQIDRRARRAGPDSIAVRP